MIPRRYRLSDSMGHNQLDKNLQQITQKNEDEELLKAETKVTDKDKDQLLAQKNEESECVGDKDHKSIESDKRDEIVEDKDIQVTPDDLDIKEISSKKSEKQVSGDQLSLHKVSKKEPDVKAIIEKRKESLGDRNIKFDLCKDNEKNDNEENSTNNVISISIAGDRMFLTNIKGQIVEISLKEKCLLNDYGIIHEGEIMITVVSPDHQWLFAVGETNLYQQNIKIPMIHKIYLNQHEGEIKAAVITKNSKYIFTADWNGDVKQHLIKNGQLVKHYKKCHNAWINSIVTTSDSYNLFTSCFKGELKQISIELKAVMFDYGKIHEGEIYSICVAKDDQYLFTSDSIGCIKQYDIINQILIRDYIGFHTNCIMKLVPNYKGTHIFTLDNKNIMKKFSLNRFVSETDFWHPDNKFQVAHAVRYYNYKREMNFQSSILIKNIDTNVNHKCTNEFLYTHMYEIMKEYIECKRVSKWDILIMLHALIYFELDTFIPEFLHCLKINTKASKLEINTIEDTINTCIDENNGIKILQFYNEYQFTKIKNIDRATRRLIQAGVIQSSLAYKYLNAEHLDSDAFYQPKETTGPIDVEIYKFNYAVDQKNPDHGFSNYLKNLRLHLDNKSLKDPILQKQINYIWKYYQMNLIIYLIYSCIPLLFFVSKSHFIGKDNELFGYQVVDLCNFMGIASAFYIPIHIFLQFVSSGWKFFSVIEHIIDLFTIIAYGLNFIVWYLWPERSTLTVFTQAIVVLFGFTKLWLQMNYIDLIRQFNSNIIRVLGSIKAFLVIVMMFVLCFAEVFFVSEFYHDNDYGTGFGDYCMVAYDVFFANWGASSMPEEFDHLQWFYYLVFLLFTLLFPILVFNILIALVDDAYHQNDDNILSDDCREKIQMSLQVSDKKSIINKIFFGCCHKAKDKLPDSSNKSYLYVIMEKREMEEAEIDFGEWKKNVIEDLKDIKEMGAKLERMDQLEVQIQNSDAKLNLLMKKMEMVLEKLNVK